MWEKHRSKWSLRLRSWCFRPPFFFRYKKKELADKSQKKEPASTPLFLYLPDWKREERREPNPNPNPNPNRTRIGSRIRFSSFFSFLFSYRLIYKPIKCDIFLAPFNVLSCLVMSCLSCLVMSCHVLSCLVMSCHVLSNKCILDQMK